MSALREDVRIAPGGLRDVGPLAWTIAQLGGRRMNCEPMNLFLVLGRHRRLFRRWLFFAAGLMPRGRLPRADTELVILRVAHRTGSRYEWQQHVRIARGAGLSAADVERVAGSGEPGWFARQAVLLAATDQLIAMGDLDDDTWSQLREHLDEPAAIELIMLVAHYQMLATTIRTLRIPTERSGR